MKIVDFYFDFASPCSYIVFEILPIILQNTSYRVRYKPIFLDALLKQLDPLPLKEILGKKNEKRWYVDWIAQAHSISLTWPKVFPFDTSQLLWLAISCGFDGQPNRYVCETIMRHVWRDSINPMDPAEWVKLHDQIKVHATLSADEIKNHLNNNISSALDIGIFYAPTLCVDRRLFSGIESLPMLQQHLYSE
jgi:2-hydroxychromene-2-carboxylate isomerase